MKGERPSGHPVVVRRGSGETALSVVSGPIGCGKSTWVRGEMARRGWKAEEIRGYRTYWAGERGAGGHLELATWDGRVSWRGKSRAGGGRPDGEGLAAAALAALEEGAGRRVLVIDELGVLEAGDARLKEAVAEAVAVSREGIVVVQERAMGVWEEAVGGKDLGDGWDS